MNFSFFIDFSGSGIFFEKSPLFYDFQTLKRMDSIVGQENLPVKNNLLFDDCSLFKSTIFEEKFREQ